MYGEVIGGNVTQILRRSWVSSDTVETALTWKMIYAGELPSAEWGWGLTGYTTLSLCVEEIQMQHD